MPTYKNILVTGGAGFIGSNLIRHLAENYPASRILVLDALTYAGSVNNLPAGALSIDHPQFRFWYGNVCNADLVASLVAEADAVIHLAAETHVTRSIFDNLLFFQTDVLGTHSVANAVLKAGKSVKRFVHISTSEVYGTAYHTRMNEDHPLNPMSPYASAKCGADRLVYSYWATYKIPAVIIRPFNNYGPRQHLEKVLPRFITSTMIDEDLTVHGAGGASRDFVYVDDVCRAIDLVLAAPAEKVVGEIFNVASGEDRTVKGIANDVVELTGYDARRITFTGDRPGQVIRHTGDWSKINAILGWKPEVTWDEGLRKTLAWYQENKDWWAQQMWMRHVPISVGDDRIEYH